MLARVVQFIVLALAVSLAGAILLGFTGKVFPPGDSFAVVRPVSAALLVFLAAALWVLNFRRFSLVSLVLASVAITSIAPDFLRAEENCESHCITLYQKNLHSKAWPRYQLADDIVSSTAQVVTLQEVSDHNRQYMAKLFDHYAFSISCEFRPKQEVAILTSLATVPGSEFCFPVEGIAGVKVVLPDNRLVWFMSVHLEWPFPYGQFNQSRNVSERIKKLDGPVVISGDFNMVPWGASVQRIRKAAGNEFLGRARSSYSPGIWLLPLPIDNVIVPKGAIGSIEMRPKLGSDHLGVLARVELR